MSHEDRAVYEAWIRAADGMTNAQVAARMPSFSEGGVSKLRRSEPSRLAKRTRELMLAFVRGGRGGGVVREVSPPYEVGSPLDKDSRVWIQEFLLRLTRAGCTEPEVDEARTLLSRSSLTDYLTGGAPADHALAPEDRLRSLRAVAEHVIIPTLRRRGRKVDASLAR